MHPILSLGLLDVLVLLLFLGLILWLGFSAKLKDSSVLQYLVAGRNLSMPAFIATLVTTWYGDSLIVGDSVAWKGIGALLLFGVPYYGFGIAYALIFARRVRQAEQISIPERLARNWGRPAAVIGAVLVFLLAVPAAYVLMLGTLVHLFTGLALHPSIVVATIVGTLFLYKGGLLADVRVGMLAFVMMYLGFFLMTGWCLAHHSPAHMIASLNPGLRKWDGGAGVLGFLSFFILGAWTMVDPAFHQRVASARTPEIGRKGLFVCVGCWVLFDILTITTALYAVSLLNPKLSGLEFFPRLGDQILPPGLKAVFLCGLTGSIVSAMVGYTLVSGATFGREFLMRLRPGGSESTVKIWTRLGVVVASVVAIAVAWVVRNAAVDLWVGYSGVVIGALLVPVCVSYMPNFKLSARPLWVSASMVAAFVASLAWLIWCMRTQNANYEVSLAGEKISLGTLVPGVIVSLVVLCFGEAAGRRALKA